MSFILQGGNVPYQPLGGLFNQSSWPNFNDWTASGFTPTVVSNELQVIGTGDLLKFISNSAYKETNLMKWKITEVFRPQNETAASYALFAGINGTSNSPGTARSVQAGVVISSTPAAKGYARIYRAGVSVAVSATPLTYSVNDRIKYEFVRDNFIYTLTVTNLTNPNSISVSYTVDPILTTNALHWIGRFATYAFNGTFLIESYKVETTTLINPSAIFVGNSRSEGFSTSLGFAGLYESVAFQASSKRFEILSKGNNRTQDILNAMTETLLFRPSYFLLNIGYNDVRTAVLEATIETNYTSIRNQLAAIAPVIHILPSPDISGTNLTAFISYLNTSFPSDAKVDANTGFNTGTMLVADGIHINDLGMQFIANKIVSTVPYIL